MALLITCRDQVYLEGLVAEVEKNVEGKRVKVEGEDDEEEAPQFVPYSCSSFSS